VASSCGTTAGLLTGPAGRIFTGMKTTAFADSESHSSPFCWDGAEARVLRLLSVTKMLGALTVVLIGVVVAV